nr:P-loop NTPase fold protein [Pseudomonas sp.]
MGFEGKIAWSGDLLKRKEIAELLTDYVDGAEHIKVVNIDSPWGTGKTFFLTNWRADLYSSRAVVYFNAWENDFTGDPMISLIANIRDQLKDFLPKTAKAKKGLEDFLSKAGSAVVSAAPIIARGVVKKSFGFDPAELGETTESESGADGNYDSAAAIAEKFVERLIESNHERMMSIKRFKDSLSTLVSFAMEKTNKPVYIFIDELDRCRPTYAIELLERVKHIFDVEGCKFIIASDTSQLVHSIKAVYGDGFESRNYLRRFFDVVYAFSEPNMREWVLFNINFECKRKLGYVPSEDSIPRIRRSDYVTTENSVFYDSELTEEQLVFLLLVRCFKVELRQLNRIRDTLALVLSKNSLGSVHYFYAAYLCFLYFVDVELFERFVDSKSASDSQSIVEARFPAKDRLYFLYEVSTVHNIAFAYRQVTSLNREALYNYSSRAKTAYVLGLISDQLEGKSKLHLYPDLVRLAVGIE